MTAFYQVTAVTADGVEHDIVSADCFMDDGGVARQIARRLSRLPGVDHIKLGCVEMQYVEVEGGEMTTVEFRYGDHGDGDYLPRRAEGNRP